MHEQAAGPPESVLRRCGWPELFLAADGAGRLAARAFAARCHASDLGRTGEVWVQVDAPPSSALTSWLRQHGHLHATSPHDAVLLPVHITPSDLHPTAHAPLKAGSLLVRCAYASAYCTALFEGAGFPARPHIDPDPAIAVPHSWSPWWSRTWSAELARPGTADERVGRIRREDAT